MGERRFDLFVAICAAATEDDRNYIVVYGGRDTCGRIWMRIRGSRNWYGFEGCSDEAGEMALRFNQAAGWSPVYVAEAVSDELIAEVDWSCPIARA